MVDALYARQGSENSGWITDSLLRAAAKEAGANGDAILSVSPSALVTSMLKNAEAEAKADAIAGTPTFVVQRAPALPKQLQLSGLDPASFEAALAAVLQ